MYNILICDDDRDIVNALKIYLSNPSYRIFEAYNGAQALDVAMREEIHLILTDVMMPELDGISATVKLRETSNVPIILLTAKSEDSDKILGLNLGADDYVTKPFNPAEVTERFVRGDASRTTEGNGLGLSIAQSLTELQGGSMRLTVDGDLFKVTLRFPKI